MKKLSNFQVCILSAILCLAYSKSPKATSMQRNNRRANTSVVLFSANNVHYQPPWGAEILFTHPRNQLNQIGIIRYLKSKKNKNRKLISVFGVVFINKDGKQEACLITREGIISFGQIWGNFISRPCLGTILKNGDTVTKIEEVMGHGEQGHLQLCVKLGSIPKFNLHYDWKEPRLISDRSMNIPHPIPRNPSDKIMYSTFPYRTMFESIVRKGYGKNRFGTGDRIRFISPSKSLYGEIIPQAELMKLPDFQMEGIKIMAYPLGKNRVRYFLLQYLFNKQNEEAIINYDKRVKQLTGENCCYNDKRISDIFRWELLVPERPIFKRILVKSSFLKLILKRHFMCAGDIVQLGSNKVALLYEEAVDGDPSNSLFGLEFKNGLGYTNGIFHTINYFGCTEKLRKRDNEYKGLINYTSVGEKKHESNKEAYALIYKKDLYEKMQYGFSILNFFKINPSAEVKCETYSKTFAIEIKEGALVGFSTKGYKHKMEFKDIAKLFSSIPQNNEKLELTTWNELRDDDNNLNQLQLFDYYVKFLFPGTKQTITLRFRWQISRDTFANYLIKNASMYSLHCRSHDSDSGIFISIFPKMTIGKMYSNLLNRRLYGGNGCYASDIHFKRKRNTGYKHSLYRHSLSFMVGCQLTISKFNKTKNNESLINLEGNTRSLETIWNFDEKEPILHNLDIELVSEFKVKPTINYNLVRLSSKDFEDCKTISNKISNSSGNKLEISSFSCNLTHTMKSFNPEPFPVELVPEFFYLNGIDFVEISSNIPYTEILLKELYQCISNNNRVNSNVFFLPQKCSL